MDTLNQRLDQQDRERHQGNLDATRRAQIGSGMRGDKIRTYRFQDDTVTDHQTGKRAKAKQVMAGRFDKLWNE